MHADRPTEERPPLTAAELWRKRVKYLEGILASDIVWYGIRHLSKYPSDWMPDHIADTEPFDELEFEVRRLNKERTRQETNDAR